MADNIAASWIVQQFSTNIQLLLQQKGSRLREKCMTGTHVGQQASPVDQIAPITANKVTARFAPMPRTDANLARRWVAPVDYDANQLVDTFDKLRILTDPMAHYCQNAVFALGRAQDAEIFNAFFGTSMTGVDGGTNTSFTSGNIVGVNTGATAIAGLNVAKLRAGRKILMQNEVDFDADPLFVAVNAVQHDYLLQEAQVVDLDFTERPVLMEGKVTRFLGADFIHTELVNQNNGTDDQSNANSNAVPMWVKSGMYLGLWTDIMTSVSPRYDLQSIPWQAYVKGTHGATRIDENRVIKIWCKPS